MERRRRTKPTWEDARDKGRGSIALYRYLLDYMGEHYSLWLGSRAEVEQQVLDEAVRFCGREGVDPRWATADARCIRAVVAYVMDDGWKAHRAHWLLGGPRGKPFHEWTEEEKAMRHVGNEKAEADIRLKCERQRMYTQQSNEDQAVAAYRRRIRSRNMRRDGFAVEEIMATLGVSRSTVYGYLEGDPD